MCVSLNQKIPSLKSNTRPPYLDCFSRKKEKQKRCNAARARDGNLARVQRTDSFSKWPTNWPTKEQRRYLNCDRYTRVPIFTSTWKWVYPWNPSRSVLVCKTVLDHQPFHFLIFPSLEIVLAILDARLIVVYYSPPLLFPLTNSLFIRILCSLDRLRDNWRD